MPFDTIVVGAGTAGCVLAARLSEDPRRSVLLLEAGPDYPDPAALPPEIVTSREGAATTHDWGYSSEPGWLERSIPLLRGKIVGGSAAINNSVAIRGDTPRDYDAWADLGNPGWSFADVLPFFRRLETDTDVQNEWHGVDGPLPIGRPSRDNLDATQRAFLDACASLGHRQVEDHNAPGAIGVGPFPSTGLGGVRHSTAGMYLHPARARPNLALRDRVTVDRVVCRADRAVGVQLAESGEIVDSQQIILAAGAYGSPTILLRSGIGPVDQLRDLNIPVIADRPGVGRALKDHPLLGLAFTVVEQPPGIPPATVLLTCRSSPMEEGFDLHVFARAHVRTAHESSFQIGISLMKPRSNGQLRLRSADPAIRPIVDLGFFADPYDLPRFLEGIRLARRLARTEPLSGLVIKEQFPGSATSDASGDLALAVRAQVSTYNHASGTCRMGPAANPNAVVDMHGQVHGLDGLFVIDASIMPTIPAGNTNIPTVMVAERCAAWLANN
jgi:choline dehydrogenase